MSTRSDTKRRVQPRLGTTVEGAQSEPCSGFGFGVRHASYGELLPAARVRRRGHGIRRVHDVFLGSPLARRTCLVGRPSSGERRRGRRADRRIDGWQRRRRDAVHGRRARRNRNGHRLRWFVRSLRQRQEMCAHVGLRGQIVPRFHLPTLRVHERRQRPRRERRGLRWTLPQVRLEPVVRRSGGLRDGGLLGRQMCRADLQRRRGERRRNGRRLRRRNVREMRERKALRAARGLRECDLRRGHVRDAEVQRRRPERR